MEKEKLKSVVFRLGAAREKCALSVYEVAVAGKEGSAILAKILLGLSCRLIDGQCHKKGASALAALSTPVTGEELTALLQREYPKLTVTVETATAREMLTKEVSDRVLGLLAALPPAKVLKVGTSVLEVQVLCPEEFLVQAENLARRFGAEMESHE